MPWKFEQTPCRNEKGIEVSNSVKKKIKNNKNNLNQIEYNKRKSSVHVHIIYVKTLLVL